jgi:hypothetical protein
LGTVLLKSDTSSMMPKASDMETTEAMLKNSAHYTPRSCPARLT